MLVTQDPKRMYSRRRLSVRALAPSSPRSHHSPWAASPISTTTPRYISLWFGRVSPDRRRRRRREGKHDFGPGRIYAIVPAKARRANLSEEKETAEQGGSDGNRANPHLLPDVHRPVRCRRDGRRRTLHQGDT